jgi:hypothetical protein
MVEPLHPRFLSFGKRNSMSSHKKNVEVMNFKKNQLDILLGVNAFDLLCLQRGDQGEHDSPVELGVDAAFPKKLGNDPADHRRVIYNKNGFLVHCNSSAPLSFEYAR